jgi:hypothetical protein
VISWQEPGFGCKRILSKLASQFFFTLRVPAVNVWNIAGKRKDLALSKSEKQAHLRRISKKILVDGIFCAQVSGLNFVVRMFLPKARDSCWIYVSIHEWWWWCHFKAWWIYMIRRSLLKLVGRAEGWEGEVRHRRRLQRIVQNTVLFARG